MVKTRQATNETYRKPQKTVVLYVYPIYLFTLIPDAVCVSYHSLVGIDRGKRNLVIRISTNRLQSEVLWFL